MIPETVVAQCERESTAEWAHDLLLARVPQRDYMA